MRINVDLLLFIEYSSSNGLLHSTPLFPSFCLFAAVLILHQWVLKQLWTTLFWRDCIQLTSVNPIIMPESGLGKILIESILHTTLPLSSAGWEGREVYVSFAQPWSERGFKTVSERWSTKYYQLSLIHCQLVTRPGTTPPLQIHTLDSSSPTSFADTTRAKSSISSSPLPCRRRCMALSPTELSIFCPNLVSTPL